MPTVVKLRNRPASSGPHLHFELDSTHDATLPSSECQPCRASRELQLATAEQEVNRRPPSPAAAGVTWSGPIILEGQLTGDGRYIQPNALTWDTLPVPLRFAREDTGEHNGAVVVGRILSITRKPGGIIWAEGDFDTVHPDSIEAARQVREQLSNGVSADLDNVSFTVKVAAELVEDEGIPGEPDDLEEDADGRVTVLDIDADAEIMDIDDARIRAATLVAVPAFSDARISIDDSDRDDESDPDGDDEPVIQGEELVAAGGPHRPPADWFSDPNLTAPTPLTITDDGRIFGHAATWNSCHTGFQQECVQPPRSASNYSYFRTGSLVVGDGTEIPVGHITLDTFHAGKQLGAADTIAHYEHTGATVADVAAGEDEHGIWVAGAVRPNLTDDDLRTLRSSPLSGDWRRIGGNLELVAALAVNVPGFPVPRAQGLVASTGAVQTLVASGVVEHRYNKGGELPGPADVQRSDHDISGEALDYLRKLTAADHNRLRAASLRRKVRAYQLERRVRNVRSPKKAARRGGQ